MSKRIDISEEKLLELRKTMTSKEMAVYFGVSYHTIRKRFKEYGIHDIKYNKHFVSFEDWVLHG